MTSKWINDFGVTVDEDLLRARDRARIMFDHNGTKGVAVEFGLNERLRSVLAGNHRVGTGQIVDVRDRRSGQIDLILYDDTQLFLPASPASPGIYLADSVRAAVEVKMTITANHIAELTKNDGWAHKLKNVRRVLGSGDRVSPLLTPSEFVRFTDRVCTVIFAYESAIDAEKLGLALGSTASILVTSNEKTYQYLIPAIDAVFVLGMGVFVNELSVGASPALSFSYGLEGSGVQTFEQWKFWPETTPGGIRMSTTMRLAFFLSHAAPRIERHAPAAFHYLMEPADQHTKRDVQSVLVKDYVDRLGPIAGSIHHH